MKIICGYKKDNYEFIVEKEFRKTFTILKSINDFFSFEIVCTKRKEWEYFIKLCYKNLILSSRGLKKDYILYDNMTNISLNNERYEIMTRNEKGKESHFICKKNSFKKVRDIDKYKEKEDKINYENYFNDDPKIKKLALQKLHDYKKRLKSEFKKVNNIKALDNALYNILYDIIEGEVYYDNVEDFDVEKFIELCIIKERNIEYVKKHADYKNFQRKFSNKFPTNLSNKDIEEIFNEQVISFNENNKNYAFSKIYVNMHVLSPEEEINSFFDIIFKEINIVSKNREERQTENSIKIKYFEKIKNNEYFNKDTCIDIDDFKKNISSFFRETIVVNEEIFVKDLKTLLQDYDDFQKYFAEYNKHFSEENTVFDLTSELEEKFKRYEKKEIDLNEKEKNCYKYIYTQINEDINNVIYIKNTKKLKPTFLELPKYIEWAKKFFSWLLDNQIIANDVINQENLIRLSNIPKHLLNYKWF